MHVKELDIVKKNIAAEFKRLRGGMDQASFAEKCQTSQPCISRWEKGAGIPSVESLMDVAKACRVSVADIIGAAVKGLPAWKPTPKAPAKKIVKPVKKAPAKKDDQIEAKAEALAAALDDKPAEVVNE